jgi:cyclopropane fatty-acyl-phospholipid synthase-like methyltransferase
VLHSDVLDVSPEYDSSFDTVASVDVLEHLTLPNVITFLKRARALLVPGGILTVHVPMPNQRRHFRAFDDWSHHDHEREGFTVEEMINVFAASGFEVTELAKTGGYFGSLAWEINMKLAATFAQAVLFPPLLLIALLDDVVKSRRYNGLLITGKRLA